MFCCLATPLDDDGIDDWIAAKPFQRVAIRFKERGIRVGGFGDEFLTIVEYIDVTGVAGCVPIERSAAGDVTFRVAMRGQ
jgi:hypothetical protein